MSQFLNERIFGGAVPRLEDGGDIQEVHGQIVDICRRIEAAESMFDLADSEEIIDACSYQIKTLRAYLDHLLRCAKGAPAPAAALEQPDEQRERIGGTMG